MPHCTSAFMNRYDLVLKSSLNTDTYTVRRFPLISGVQMGYTFPMSKAKTIGEMTREELIKGIKKFDAIIVKGGFKVPPQNFELLTDKELVTRYADAVAFCSDRWEDYE